ncbi:MAG TPA: NAD(P)-dependent oxidoreductase [Gemmatimonadales bacterium]|nr:NAD(P)-dependent oxidoreductase [Gemmatimonadales bacterium]
MNSPLIAVTGATGFIGRAVVEALLPTARVRALVRRQTAHTCALASRGVELSFGDLAEPDAAKSLVRGADVVIHCAAQMGRADPAKSYAINVIGTERLARAARAAAVGRFIYVSSISVLGATRRPDNVLTEDDEPADTEHLNAYARSKYLGECRLRDAAGPELAWTVIRPTNVYGLGSGPWFKNWIRSIHRLPVALGDVAIDVVNVDDVVQALCAAAAMPPYGNHVLHVSHEMVKLNRYVQAIADMIGRRAWTLPSRVDAVLRWIIERGYRLVSGRHMSLALTRSVRYPHARATAVLDYLPRVRFSEGLRMMTEQYRLQGCCK